MGTPKDSEITKAKIIEAAGRLFTQKGFSGVTVREIAKEAEVHLGALNYHFKSKKKLYREVLLEACRDSSILEEDRLTLMNLDPETALFIIVKESLDKHKDQDISHWRSAILSRECWSPSDDFDEIAKEYLKPQSEFIASLIGDAVNKKADDKSVQFAEIALTGLIESFGLYRHYTEVVAEGLSEHGFKDDWLAKKITKMVIDSAG